MTSSTPTTLYPIMSPHIATDATTCSHTYHSSPENSSASKQEQENHPRGLGLYECSLPIEAQNTSSDLSLSSSAPSSASPVQDDWSQSGLDQQISTAHTPEMFTASFNPFPSFSEEPQSTYPSTTSITCDSLVPDLSYSPTPSRSLSSRSSISSVGPPDTFIYTTKQDSLTPRVKMESSSDWMTDISMGNAVSNGEMNGTSGPFVQGIPMHTSTWSSPYFPPDQYYPAPEAPGYVMADSQYRGASKILNDAERTRKPRRMTTPAEANHTCQTCGKLFSRSYNYKAHLETHDPSREHPHVCQVDGCTKKFVRKTDLVRHHQSVHEKRRSFQCILCGNLFARKDTLRRHTEDGCSKRLEISSKSLRTPSVSSTTSSGMASPESQPRATMRPGLLPPPALASPPGIMLTSPLPPPMAQPSPYFARELYQTQNGPHY